MKRLFLLPLSFMSLFAILAASECIAPKAIRSDCAIAECNPQMAHFIHTKGLIYTKGCQLELLENPFPLLAYCSYQGNLEVLQSW